MKIKNKLVADRMGISESGVSLIRHGLRFPRMDTMEKVEHAFGWSVTEQVAVRKRYAEEFEQVVEAHFAKHGVL